MTAPKCPGFIDSNVWIYAATQSQDNPPDPRHKIARQLIAQVQPCLSVQVINEVAVNLLRKFSFSEAEIWSFVRSLYKNYTVFSIDADTFIQASMLRETYQISFWDSLIVGSALQHQCSFLYSEDMQNGLVIENQLQIHNPFTSKFNKLEQ
ncbi:MAG: PIN domain-containing protein [Chroococcidiopsidaceae cyanobacterium CP_BM_RX_35]|nr:PIN domain-containing protein [Chroococcidiopsidaceae cyanobacterium CP_BM_RX_35]